MENKIVNSKLHLLCLVALVFIFWNTMDTAVAQEKKTHICYQAKICVHNGREKCGVNSKGEPRRFLDTCDIKEFNCLYKTDYARTDENSCENLPPIMNTTSDSNHTNHLPKDLTFSVDDVAVPNKAIQDIKNELTQVEVDKKTKDAAVKEKKT